MVCWRIYRLSTYFPSFLMFLLQPQQNQSVFLCSFYANAWSHSIRSWFVLSGWQHLRDASLSWHYINLQLQITSIRWTWYLSWPLWGPFSEVIYDSVQCFRKFKAIYWRSPRLDKIPDNRSSWYCMLLHVFASLSFDIYCLKCLQQPYHFLITPAPFDNPVLLFSDHRVQLPCSLVVFTVHQISHYSSLWYISSLIFIHLHLHQNLKHKPVLSREAYCQPGSRI